MSKIIYAIKRPLNQYIARIPQTKLLELFKETHNHFVKGIMTEDELGGLKNLLRTIDEFEIDTDISCTKIEEMEAAVLYEMARRYYNLFFAEIELDEHTGMFSWLSKMN